MNSVIEVKNLTKKFKDFTAVKDFSFSANQGELVGLLGINGAGKTTAIRMLIGQCGITEGDAIISGYSVKNELEKIKPLINISPQENAIAPNLSVYENLEFIGGLYGLKGETLQNRINEALETCGLYEVKKKKARLLSGGMQRRLSISLALLTKPKILFLDEPTLGLDVLARRELWHTIQLLKKDTTIILTTHYLEEAEFLCDKVIIIQKGIKIAEGSVEKLKKMADAKNLEDAFVALCQKGVII